MYAQSKATLQSSNVENRPAPIAYWLFFDLIAGVLCWRGCLARRRYKYINSWHRDDWTSTPQRANYWLWSEVATLLIIYCWYYSVEYAVCRLKRSPCVWYGRWTTEASDDVCISCMVAANWFTGRDIDSKGGYRHQRTTNFVSFLPIIVATFGLRLRQPWFRFLIGLGAPPWWWCEMWELRDVVVCFKASLSFGRRWVF